MNAVKRCRWVVASLIFLLPLTVRAQTVQVAPTVETDPVPSSGDAADDPAIWIHPTNPALSLILGTNKRDASSGLGVYDLSGKEVQYISSVEPNNVDLRYNFPLGNSYVDIVGVSNEAGDVISVFKVDPGTRRLEDVTARDIDLGINAYGFCMYHSPVSGKFYAIVTSDSGKIEQWELFDNGNGKVDARLVRSFSVGSRTEGCVADDVYGVLYLAEEDKAIWKYGAEPGDGSSRTQIDAVASGRLNDDIEGLTIYYGSDGSGYLIASSQGNKEFVVYRRDGNNAYVMTFKIVGGNGIDGVVATDGIDVTNVSLGPNFPYGVFVAQDGANDNGNQNFKLVPWEAIANAVSPALAIDTSWDPRTGGPGGGSSTLPVITSFVPTSGIVGTQVTITGSNLTDTTEVRFDETSALPLDVSDSTVVVAVPAGATSGPISVVTSEGVAVSNVAFTIEDFPEILALTPSSGPVGTEVTVTGMYLTGTTAVTFNGTLATNVIVDSDTQLRAAVPAGATSGPLSVTNAVGTVESSTDFTVSVASPSTTVAVRVAATADDAEEKTSGSVGLTSSDLELGENGKQTVGIRFAAVTIPAGATILQAYVQFQVDEVSTGAATLLIQGQASDDAPSFSSSTRNISSRQPTAAAIQWTPAPWPTVGAAGPDQQTPNIASIIQEIVDLPGWASGQAIVVMITGSGKRVAESYNGQATAAPLLHVEYAAGG